MYIKTVSYKDFAGQERKEDFYFNLTEAEVMEMFKAEGKAEGREDVNRLNNILIETGRIDDLTRSVKDPAFQQKLFEELLGSK